MDLASSVSHQVTISLGEVRDIQRGREIAHIGIKRGRLRLHNIHNTHTTNPNNSNLIKLLASQYPVNEPVFGDTLQKNKKVIQG